MNFHIDSEQESQAAPVCTAVTPNNCPRCRAVFASEGTDLPNPFTERAASAIADLMVADSRARDYAWSGVI